MSATPDIDPSRADRFVAGPGDYTITLPAAETIGAQLKQLREARGVTQVQLAERLGIQQTHVSRLEHSRNPEFATVLGYLHALDVDAAQLVVGFASGTEIALPLPSDASTE